ncbi:hypothetical protein Hamer_G000688 [Homarus americanus]|uniref:Uncharacterized protein n=1 Tax=Homarus americanus TaxID=6706 RepID=A0A8J5N241_HOMAM|nr:hypothetical protein Hamer_G000688 [Homarus americanus]
MTQEFSGERTLAARPCTSPGWGYSPRNIILDFVVSGYHQAGLPAAAASLATVLSWAGCCLPVLAAAAAASLATASAALDAYCSRPRHCPVLATACCCPRHHPVLGWPLLLLPWTACCCHSLDTVCLGWPLLLP